MTIPKLTPYTGEVANPDGSQTQSEFTTNMFNQLSYEAQLATELDATVDGMNQAVTDVENSAAAASASATAAEASASTAGYQGLWPDTGGSALKGETWQTQVGGTPTGEYYTALQNTNIDPVGDNVNWKVGVSGGYVNKAQEELINGGIFPANGTVKNGDVVDLGVTHLRVLVGGEPTIVKMSPPSSGAVSNLTENGATIGATSVVFRDWFSSSLLTNTKDEINLEDYRSIAIHVTGERRPLAYIGRLTESNHSDVLSTAIQAAADESFKLYVPNKDVLNLSGWVTPVLSKRLLIEFEDYTQINSDTAVDFIQLSNTLQHDGIVTLDGFLAGFEFKNIVDDIELYSRGLRCKNGKHTINMRYSDNQLGSLARAIINDTQGHAMSSWGLDISPAVFGDMFINFPKFTDCKTRFIGIGNNASGETYSTNQRIEINSLTGIGLTEAAGVTELQGAYITGCQDVHMGGKTNIRDLVHTSSAVDAEGIYIKAAYTTIEDALLKNAGGNQGVIVVKGSASGSEVKTTCKVNASIESTYDPTLPTCPAYVQADDVVLNLDLKGTFTRGVQTVENAKVNSLKVNLSADGVVCNDLVDITTNCESVEVSAQNMIRNVQSKDSGYRPSVVKLRGSSTNPNGNLKLLKVRDVNASGFTQNGGGNLSNLVTIDMSGDTGATIGKVSVVNNDCGDLHSCVREVAGTVDNLVITGNDCMSGTLTLNNGGATNTNTFIKNNPGQPDAS